MSRAAFFSWHVRRRLFAGFGTLVVLCAMAWCTGSSMADENGLKIGILLDASGPFSDVGGKGAVQALQTAVDEAGGKALGKTIQVISADAQNKTDLGLSIAKDWLRNQGVDALADLDTSSIGLAVTGDLKNQSRGILLYTIVNAEALIGASCTPWGFMWQTDSYAWAKGLATDIASGANNTWFFIQVDFASGVSASANLKALIEAAGGKVLGQVKHPADATDFSSYLLQAQSSGAKNIALINSGAQFINSVRQANEFGIVKGGQTLVAGLTLYTSDAHTMGLEVAQGLTGVSAYEWNQSPETEAWSKKFFDKMGKMPTSAQIGVYSATKHYIKAVEAAGTTNRDAVAAKMRELPVNDAFVKNGSIRKDGRMVHDLQIIQVKTPAESKGEWDLFKTVKVIPADKAFRPLEESACPLTR